MNQNTTPFPPDASPQVLITFSPRVPVHNILIPFRHSLHSCGLSSPYVGTPIRHQLSPQSRIRFRPSFRYRPAGPDRVEIFPKCSHKLGGLNSGLQTTAGKDSGSSPLMSALSVARCLVVRESFGAFAQSHLSLSGCISTAWPSANNLD